MQLAEILGRSPVHSVDEAVGIMKAIDAHLPDADGLKWFNRLYLNVTVSVRDAIDKAAFKDRPFLTQLDIVFANLYFTAVKDAEVEVSRAPSALAAASPRQTHAGHRADSVRARGHERPHQPGPARRHRGVIPDSRRRSD